MSVHNPGTFFGGHWRDYDLDVVDLFRTSFDEVETIDMHTFDRADGGLSYGIRPGEPAFVLRQPQTRSH
jgi:hypothetical protein